MKSDIGIKKVYSLLPLTADAALAILLTGSYLCDLGGADLLATSWQVGCVGAVSILPSLSHDH